MAICEEQASYIDKQPRTQPAVEFPYEDIQATTQIRILELLPAGHGDPLKGRLVVEASNSLGPFEAVSYCWGPREAVDNIECNGKSLHINAAVSGILRQFRRPDDPHRLWVDAICINQSLKSEKDAQVPLMRDIYSKASRVRIWLGQDEERSGEAFDLIQETCNAITRAQEKHGPQPTLAQLFACDLPTNRDDRWTTLNALLNRPWFQRTWILQEVSLAQTALLHSGPHTCPWPTLAHISTILFHTQAHNALNTFAITYAARIAMIAFQDARTVDKTLAGLLIATVGLGVSNLRDRVYALLGLAGGV
ncbi:hypothetical protein PRZ48_000474 [Zasmidium cellare]|uniref:Heterokaryon incompatibility domain-containing protein n=1 Tax=Zasmidium cellare TaxID=395010 RepID=A0ABR0F012_ZASCE|nr:hypothetical protein PRZ48_000474 [Zasmidium cellare]